MRLISSIAVPQKVMNFANKACRDDSCEGGSFLSKAGQEYRWKRIKAEENKILTPSPAQLLLLPQNLKPSKQD